MFVAKEEVVNKYPIIKPILIFTFSSKKFHIDSIYIIRNGLTIGRFLYRSKNPIHIDIKDINIMNQYWNFLNDGL